jgi:hypothetical protein
MRLAPVAVSSELWSFEIAGGSSGRGSSGR